MGGIHLLSPLLTMVTTTLESPPPFGALLVVVVAVAIVSIGVCPFVAV